MQTDSSCGNAGSAAAGVVITDGGQSRDSHPWAGVADVTGIVVVVCCCFDRVPLARKGGLVAPTTACCGWWELGAERNYLIGMPRVRFKTNTTPSQRR